MGPSLGVTVIMDVQNMPDEGRREDDAGRPMVCEIKIKGHLGHQWEEWFTGLTIVLAEDGSTLLTGPVVDQAALHGLLKKVRDLGMPLLAVNFPATGPRESPQPTTNKPSMDQSGIDDPLTGDL